MYIVSSCLAGINCRYDGSNSAIEKVQDLVKEGKAIAICPEMIAGLPAPRACCEIIIDEKGNRKIVSKDGEDFTKEFMEGAKKTLEIAKILNVQKAILQSRSPSCGLKQIYDGSFCGKLKKGNGLTAELLVKNGIEVYIDNDFKI